MTDLKAYLYDLPDNRIAKYPLADRDMSKLLKYHQGEIKHLNFKEVVDHIPNDALLVFNNTKVIAARLFFYKETGAKIEIFLNEPILPHSDFQLILNEKKSCTWKCMIGNAKKWKEGPVKTVIQLPNNNSLELTATLVDREEGHVQFNWENDHSFLKIIEAAGQVPLPPYLNREAEKEDKDRYQTVFSDPEGAVAAPTAGLHFTESILDSFNQKGIGIEYLTLHVSAGTFKPIKEADYKDHQMHNEKVILNKSNLEAIINCKGPIVAVGTTAMRTLESLYWYGVKLLANPNANFVIDQNEPYNHGFDNLPSRSDAVAAVLDYMNTNNLSELKGETEIFIYPGYEFQVCSGLFTNYHQPGSTLILLVSAFVGEDWKRIYNEALENDYRFLSYGDSSLLYRSQ